MNGFKTQGEENEAIRFLFCFSWGSLEGCKGTIPRSGLEVGLKESLNKDSGVLGLT